MYKRGMPVRDAINPQPTPADYHQSYVVCPTHEKSFVLKLQGVEFGDGCQRRYKIWKFESVRFLMY